MSSKGRGAPVVDSEFYPTPAWCTRRILEALRPEWGREAEMPRTWLEPCCGEHAITSQILFLGVHMIEFGDVRPAPDFNGVSAANCGYENWNGHHDAVITNPPFSLAPELIRHFLSRCDWLILLLRASFRLGEWRRNMPDEYKLPQRPEFLASEKCKGNDGKGCGWSRKVALTVSALRVCPECQGIVQRSTSDSSEYSWFVWTPERNRFAGLTRVLPDTPLEERKAT